ncbi:MAG: hypothetical protein H8E46_08540 [FCB group bacterium]|nr:hypothetical protein [FCB group bacterium]
MDKTTLVEKDIEAGKDLVRKLDDMDLKVTSAFWIYDSDSEIYRLVIAFPFYDEHGPKAAYLKIRSVLDTFGESFRISLSNIHAVSPSDSFVIKMSKAIRVEGLSDIRFSRNVIDGEYVEDALIYRSGSL